MKMPEMGNCLFPVFLCPNMPKFLQTGEIRCTFCFFRFVLRIRKGKEMDSPEHVR